MIVYFQWMRSYSVILWEGLFLQSGGLAELCGEGDRGKLDVINNGSSTSQQANGTASVLSWSSDDPE